MNNHSTVIYSPREGVNYTIHYIIKNGMLYPEAQGFKGTPVHIGNLPVSHVAVEAARSMIAKFNLSSDAGAA